jgi:hypothetical protein
MKQIILSPEIISAIASLITALIGLVIRKIEKAPLDKKIQELEANKDLATEQPTINE